MKLPENSNLHALKLRRPHYQTRGKYHSVPLSLLYLSGMESHKPYGPTNPLLSLSTFIHQNCLRLGAELASRLDDTKRFAGTLASNWSTAPILRHRPPFASVSQPKKALAAVLSSDHVAKSLAGTAVYTVSNSNNEFVLISDPNAAKSIGLLCFRQEDAEAFLAQVSDFLAREMLGKQRIEEILSLFLSFSFSFVFLEFRPVKYFVRCVVRHFPRNETEIYSRSVLIYWWSCLWRFSG